MDFPAIPPTLMTPAMTQDGQAIIDVLRHMLSTFRAMHTVTHDKMDTIFDMMTGSVNECVTSIHRINTNMTIMERRLDKMDQMLTQFHAFMTDGHVELLYKRLEALENRWADASKLLTSRPCVAPGQSNLPDCPSTSSV